MSNNITKEQVIKAYNSAPNIVRSAFNDEKTTQIIMELQTRFRLHVDNVGILGKGVGQMLLGLVNPQEFLQELIMAKIPEKDARDIMAEINQKIFAPLREGMRSGGVNAAPPAAAGPEAPAQGGKYAPPLQSPMYARPISVSPSANAPQRNATHLVQPARPVVSTVPPARPAAMIATPKPTDNSRLLEDHEEPHIEFNKAPMLQTFPQGINRIIPAVQTAPVAPKIKLIVPTFEPKPVPPVAPAPVAPKAPPIPSKPYSTDPYREPLE